MSGISIVAKKILILIHNILGLTDKSTFPAGYGFPLTNLHFAESVDVVPQSNPLNNLNLLYICSVNLKSARLLSQGAGSQKIFQVRILADVCGWIFLVGLK